MRFRFFVTVIVSLVGAIAFGQDINRANEWHLKRPEQSQAQVEKETVFNGVSAPVGEAPAVVDHYGNPIDAKNRKSGQVDNSDIQGTKRVVGSSDRLVKNEFDMAGAVIDEADKDRLSPVLVGSVCLLVGLVVALGFRVSVRRIKVPT